MLASIEWPEKYLPGTMDNFCSNEVIVKNLPVGKVWDALIHPLLWPRYYANSSDIVFRDTSGNAALYMDASSSLRHLVFP